MSMTAKQEYALVTLVMSLANNPHIGSPAYKKELQELARYLNQERERAKEYK